ncbi:MAG: stage V sporulation protein AC [Sarcina sp.]
MKEYKSDEKIRAEFEKLSIEMEPKPKLLKNCFNAFWIGGSICVIGQIIKNTMLHFGILENDINIYLPISMIFIGAFFTGIGVYDKVAVIGGMGTHVPITGFANSMVSEAIEHKKEGYVLGLGSKMFTIAGPVLVYGIGSSVILGIIYYILLRIGGGV